MPGGRLGDRESGLPPDGDGPATAPDAVVCRIGPPPAPGMRRTYVAIASDGTPIATAFADADESGIAQLLARLHGYSVRVEVALARGRHLRVAALNAAMRETRATLHLALALDGRIVEASFTDLCAFTRAAVRFWRADPWRARAAPDIFWLQGSRRGGEHEGSYRAILLRPDRGVGAGEGLAFLSPEGAVKHGRAGRAPFVVGGPMLLAVTFRGFPEDACDVFLDTFGVPRVPWPAAPACEAARPVRGSELRLLAASLLAVASIRPELPVADAWCGSGSDEVRVRAHALHVAAAGATIH